METNNLLQSIENLKIEYNNDSICLGKKIKNGVVTDELSIVFFVDEKKPIENLTQSDLIPSRINVGGTILKTDVVESTTLNVHPCPTEFNSTCIFNPVPNRSYIRPIKGGISIRKTTDGIGTLGFLAKHTETGALVGVTNLHVALKVHFNANDLCKEPPCTFDYNSLIEQIYQPGESSSYETDFYNLGRVMYCTLLYNTGSAEIDCCLVALKESVLSNSESFKQYGLSFTTPPVFATTAELDSILTNNIPLAASGRSSGPKEGSLCGLKALYVNYSSMVNGYRKNNDGYVWGKRFANQIAYTRVDQDCPDPSIPGDSGSAVFGNFGGTWKVVGLNFAGGTMSSGIDIGIFNRIDRVAALMGIEAWDGSQLNFIDLNNVSTYQVQGFNSNNTITVDGSTYCQSGVVNS
jgi:hypothetical protein